MIIETLCVLLFGALAARKKSLISPITLGDSPVKSRANPASDSVYAGAAGEGKYALCLAWVIVDSATGALRNAVVDFQGAGPK